MPTPVSSPLLDLIKSQGFLDDLQLDEVKEEHNRSGKPVSEILQDFGFLDMDSQLQVIANHLGTEVIELSTPRPDPGNPFRRPRRNRPHVQMFAGGRL